MIPLLKTMDLLFTHDAIGHLIRGSGDTFPNSLYEHCKAAIHRSSNVPKIHSGVSPKRCSTHRSSHLMQAQILF